MARSLNCVEGPTPTPCGECQSCKDLVANGPGSLDVIEIDAATHGLVDDARDLRDKAFFAPVQSRYKIYIIDEAHQLGTGAANALLKVVEEPPPHVIFIFATTEPEKLISTIRSRTHHYPFRLVPPGILVAHLEKICNAEGVKVAKGVLPLVVRASGGSVRDALSILGQLLAGAGSDGVSYEIAIQLLGFTDGALLDDAIDALAARDGASLFKTVDRVIESGHDPRRFTSDFLERLRDLMIVEALQQTNANSILRDLPEDQIERMRTQANQIGAANLSRAADIAAEGLTQMRGATAPRLILELICGRILLPGGDTSERGLLSRIERLERAESISVPAVTSIGTANFSEKVEVKEAVLTDQDDFKKASPKASDPIKTADPVKAASPVQNSAIDVTGLRRIWPDVIEEVKKKRRLTWSLLSASAHIVSMDDKSITIGIVNPGARDSFLRSESDVILRQAFVDVVGVDKKIEVIVDSSIDTNTPAARAVRVDESPTDKNQLSGPELLARELGAKIVKDDR
jgi:DNA polymerase-3 subunit gamma/tau